MASIAQTPNPPFAGYADLPGVRLWCTDSGGNGVPLVLLHANTGNADSWQYNVPGLVEAVYRVVTFDRRLGPQHCESGQWSSASIPEEIKF